MQIEEAKLVVSILGFAGTIATILLAIRQYKRAEQWKRAEFVAREVKDFESNPAVRNALSMIDWSTRRVNLAQKQNPTDEDLEFVTRTIQWKALLPHTVKSQSWRFKAGDSELSPALHSGPLKEGFTLTEARIRDSYDLFLDYLQRFSSFVESDLLTVDQLRPYIGYWIDDIASEDGSDSDLAWRCTLLVYIDFYRFRGVQRLFNSFGRAIDPDSKLFRSLKEDLKKSDPDLKDALDQAIQYGNGNRGNGLERSAA